MVEANPQRVGLLFSNLGAAGVQIVPLVPPHSATGTFGGVILWPSMFPFGLTNRDWGVMTQLQWNGVSIVGNNDVLITELILSDWPRGEDNGQSTA